MKDDVALERDDGDESDETESQEAETAIESIDRDSQGRLISEGGVINSIIITRSECSVYACWFSLDGEDTEIASEAYVHMISKIGPILNSPSPCLLPGNKP